MNELISFGKYRGMPVEAILHDDKYVNWLTAQPWFKEKFISVYNTIISFGKEPACTPEHNKLQIKFLDCNYCQRFLDTLKVYYINDSNKFDEREFLYKDVVFEDKGVDVVLTYTKGWLSEDRIKRYFFEKCFIEIKPFIGDDYPEVLRQMKLNKSNTLLFSSYVGIGAKYEEFIKFFLVNNILPIKEDKIVL